MELTEKPILLDSIEAAADLTRRHFVGFDGNIATAAATCVGVANIDAIQGEAVSVMTHGIAIVEAGAAIVAGAQVEVGAAGKAATLASGKVVGVAFSAAAQDGDYIIVRVPA